MFGKWFKASPDTVAFKLAKLKGEIAQVEFLQAHYNAKEYDPYTQWWEHAAKMQQLKELKEEHEAITNQICLLEEFK